MRRPSARAVLLSLSALLAVMALVTWQVRPEREVGTEDVEEWLAPTPAPRPPVATSPSTRPPTPAPNSTTRLDDLAGPGPMLPVRLAIPVLGVEAPVEPHGVDLRTGQMSVPGNVTEVAWYEHGPAPGEGGSAVLAAHVDQVGRGPGVFFRLRELEPGDEIIVGHSDGTRTRFSVVARILYQKDELPLDAIFANSGAPVLTLVTCGGGFDSSRQSYEGNVVVFATPVAAPQGGPVQLR